MLIRIATTITNLTINKRKMVSKNYVLTVLKDIVLIAKCFSIKNVIKVICQ